MLDQQISGYVLSHTPVQSFLSPRRRLYPPGRSPLRDGVEPEALQGRQSHDQVFLCEPCPP